MHAAAATATDLGQTADAVGGAEGSPAARQAPVYSGRGDHR